MDGLLTLILILAQWNNSVLEGGFLPPIGVAALSLSVPSDPPPHGTSCYRKEILIALTLAQWNKVLKPGGFLS